MDQIVNDGDEKEVDLREKYDNAYRNMLNVLQDLQAHIIQDVQTTFADIEDVSAIIP